MTREELVHIVDTAHGPFSVKADKNTYRGWWLALQFHDRNFTGLTVESCLTAVAELLAEPGRAFPPTPGQVTEILTRPIWEARQREQAEKKISEMRAALALKESELQEDALYAQTKAAAKDFLTDFWSKNPDTAKILGRA